MVRLVMLLLGVDYLRTRATGIFWIGVAWVVAGLVVFGDALDGAMHFPITLFAWLFLLEGLATLAVAWTGVGGQRALRYVKGIAVVTASMLIFAGHHHGNLILSMIFGTLFLVDGLLQCVAAWIVRYRRWKAAFAWGVFEILIAVFFYQPYPTHYAGTLPKADLDRYVARHAQTCGEAVDTATLIPHMALMDGNRGFKQRKA